VADGLDGAVARVVGRSDRGGFLDITLDFAFYGMVPLGFALSDPLSNALPAAFLLASFYVNGAAFLAFAALAGRRGLTTEAQGVKSLYYLAGIAEGTETIAVFAAMCLFPAWFPALATGFAVVTTASAAARIIAGAQALR
jgi:phosphatidylglycerophosphate synthase